MTTEAEAKKLSEQKTRARDFASQMSNNPKEQNLDKKLVTVFNFTQALMVYKDEFVKICAEIGVLVEDSDPINQKEIGLTLEVIAPFMMEGRYNDDFGDIQSYVKALHHSVKTKLLRIGIILAAQAAEPCGRYESKNHLPDASPFGTANYLITDWRGSILDYIEIDLMFKAVIWLKNNKGDDLRPPKQGRKKASFLEISIHDIRSLYYYEMRTRDDKIVANGGKAPSRAALNMKEYVKQINKFEQPDDWELGSPFSIHSDSSSWIKSLSPSNRVETRGFDLSIWPK